MTASPAYALQRIVLVPLSISPRGLQRAINRVMSQISATSPTNVNRHFSSACAHCVFGGISNELFSVASNTVIDIRDSLQQGCTHLSTKITPASIIVTAQPWDIDRGYPQTTLDQSLDSFVDLLRGELSSTSGRFWRR